MSLFGKEYIGSGFLCGLEHFEWFGGLVVWFGLVWFGLVGGWLWTFWVLCVVKCLWNDTTCFFPQFFVSRETSDDLTGECAETREESRWPFSYLIHRTMHVEVASRFMISPGKGMVKYASNNFATYLQCDRDDDGMPSRLFRSFFCLLHSLFLNFILFVLFRIQKIHLKENDQVTRTHSAQPLGADRNKISLWNNHSFPMQFCGLTRFFHNFKRFSQKILWGAKLFQSTNEKFFQIKLKKTDPWTKQISISGLILLSYNKPHTLTFQKCAIV